MGLGQMFLVFRHSAREVALVPIMDRACGHLYREKCHGPGFQRAHCRPQSWPERRDDEFL